MGVDAGWRTPYGQFFLEWYSGKLIQHCADVLDAVVPIVKELNAEIIEGKDYPDVRILCTLSDVILPCSAGL